MAAPLNATLDAAFRIEDCVRVIVRGGHAIVVIRTEFCAAEIALQGAQILSWKPAGHEDLLWCAPLPAAQTGKAIRGGIPVCWPWFGPHATDPALPQHGLVRTVDWRLIATERVADDVRVDFETSHQDARLRMAITVGARLRVALTTQNSGAVPLPISEALHTYFHVGDVGCASVHGLDGCSYRDNTDGGREKVWHRALTLHQETIALFDVAPDVAEIEDPVLARRIRIAREGGRSTVAWHPGANVLALKDVVPRSATHFICVESGNIGASTVVIAPGAEHRLAVTYDLAPL